MVAYHLGEGKAFGNMRALEGGRGDMWHWKGVRTNPVGQLDDEYLVHADGSGRKADPKTGGGCSNNKTRDGSLPAYATRT